MIEQSLCLKISSAIYLKKRGQRMKVYATMKEAVEDMFFRDVLGVPKKSLKKSHLLEDFCPDKRFAKEYIKMYLDKTERTFQVSIKNLQSKPVVEILEFLIKRKKNDSIYGNRPFKK